jgi:hypothetical protein
MEQLQRTKVMQITGGKLLFPAALKIPLSLPDLTLIVRNVSGGGEKVDVPVQSSPNLYVSVSRCLSVRPSLTTAVFRRIFLRRRRCGNHHLGSGKEA